MYMNFKAHYNKMNLYEVELGDKYGTTIYIKSVIKVPLGNYIDGNIYIKGYTSIVNTNSIILDLDYKGNLYNANTLVSLVKEFLRDNKLNILLNESI